MYITRRTNEIERTLDRLNGIIGKYYWRKSKAAHKLVDKLEAYREELHRELAEMNWSDWDELHSQPWKI
jgi:hypothetical protein